MIPTLRWDLKGEQLRTSREIGGMAKVQESRSTAWCSDSGVKKPTLFSALAVIAVVLLLPAVAEAKLCVRISAPPTATRGEPVRVSVVTLLPTSWASGRPIGLRPVPASVRIRLVLVGPEGNYREVAMRRVASTPSVSRTTIRLATIGTWRLSLLGWDAAPQSCAPQRLIRVV
jgi:hypothetical protein